MALGQRSITALIGCLVCCSLSHSVSAQSSLDADRQHDVVVDTPPVSFDPGVLERPPESDDVEGSVDTSVGISRIAEDTYVSTVLGFDIDVKDWRIAFGIPFRFRIADLAPPTPGIIRNFDWDEPGDYFGWLRYIRYGNTRFWGLQSDEYYLRLGDLPNVYVGHGSVVGSYRNSIDFDHRQWGVNAETNQGFWGAELLIDDLLNPDLMAARAYFHPASLSRLIDPPEGGDPSIFFWGNLQVGFTLAGDIDAPYRVRLNEELDGYAVDRRRNLIVEEEYATGIGGIDVQLEVYRSDRINVIPYMDYNRHLGFGRGFHLGSFVNNRFSDRLTMHSQLELRVAGTGYEPVYFDRQYEAHRSSFRATEPFEIRMPKFRVHDLDPFGTRLGWYGQTMLRLAGKMSIRLGFGDYGGPDNARFNFSLRLTNIGPFRFAFGISNVGFDRPGQMFERDNLLIRSQVQVQFLKVLFLKLKYGRQYEAHPRGTYQPENEWGVSGGLRFLF